MHSALPLTKASSLMWGNREISLYCSNQLTQSI